MTVATRSGGDALRKQECRVPVMQALDEKSSKYQQLHNAKSEVKADIIDRHGVGEADWIESLHECPVYYPSKEDFAEDPLQYIQKITEGASKYGMCKIVSPVLASMPAGMVLSKEQSGFRFSTRLQPMRISNWEKNDKIAFPIKGRHYTLTEYEKVANRVFSRKFSTAAALPPRFIESEFWKELVGGKTRTVEYATDVDGSAFSTSKSDPLGQSKWNLKGISRLPGSTLRLLEEAIPGVTEPMLYIGMLFSMFAWHIEDHYLYSINYQHCGAPKTWYGVPGDAAVHFEKVVKEHVYSRELLNETGKGAELNLLLEKTTMFSPKLLKDHGVPVFRAVQYPGEFIITFPRAYHAGFSHGFNCGEAVNFAMADWFSLGAEACLRYEFLNRQPLLPHDELLCKEATTIYRMDKNTLEDSSRKQQACVMTAFVALMQSHRQVKSALEQGGAKTSTCTLSDVFCGLCKHKCYVAYTHCKCSPEPTCFNHGDCFGSCSCKGDRMIFLREDFANLQLVAQKYEREEEIRKQAQKLCIDNKGDGAPLRGVSEFIESSLLTHAASSREACQKGEDREDACSGNMLFNPETCGANAVSDCTQAQEEEEEAAYGTEVLRIKRRRVASPQSKRFQVDEQEIAQVKYLVRSLDYGISSPMRGCEGLSKREHAFSDKQEDTEDASTLKGAQPSVCQVIGEPNSGGSAAEVMSQWKSDQETALKVEEAAVGQERARVLSLNSHDKRENSMEERTSACMITYITTPKLTATTEDLLSLGELHSDIDQKRFVENQNKADLGALSSIITGSTMLNDIQEVQDVKGDGISVNGEDALEVEGPGDTSHLDVHCDPELTRVDGGHIKEGECSSSEAASMEPEPSAVLTDLVAESPVAVMVGSDNSNASSETSKPVTSHIDNAEMGNGERQGKVLPDEGRLFCAEASSLCDETSQALGAGNISHDALVDIEMIREGIIAMSSKECNKPEATTSSLPEPKRGLIIHLNRKVEQPQKKAASLSHDQYKSKDEFEEVDVFEGQAGGDVWSLGEEVGFCSVVPNPGESNCPLQYLTAMSGDDFPQHHFERDDSQQCFAGSFDMKSNRVLGETGERHGKFDGLQAGGNFPLGLEPSSQLTSAEEDHWGASESTNDLSCTEDVPPAACVEQQQVEFSCGLTDAVLEELPAGVCTSVGRDARLYDIGLDVHAPRFSRSSPNWREAFGNNVLDKHSYKTQTHGGVKTDPYIGQSTHWGRRPQGCYDFSFHHPTSHAASRNNSDKYKHMRSSSSSLHQGHHPYHRETYRYRPVFRVKERVPCGYWKRRPNRGYYGGWEDTKSNITLGGECRPIERVVDREVAGCSSNTSGGGYVEGYDPAKWEISPNRNHGQFSHFYDHLPSSWASRDR